MIFRRLNVLLRSRLQHCNDSHHLKSWQHRKFTLQVPLKRKRQDSPIIHLKSWVYTFWFFLSLFYIWNCICLTCTLILYIETYILMNISSNNNLKIRYNNQSVPTVKSWNIWKCSITTQYSIYYLNIKFITNTVT